MVFLFKNKMGSLYKDGLNPLSKMVEEIMLKRKSICYFRLAVAASLLFVQRSAFGYDITGKFSIGSFLAGSYQYQSGDNIAGFIPGIRTTVEF